MTTTCSGAEQERSTRSSLPGAILRTCFKYQNNGNLQWRARPLDHFTSARGHAIFIAMNEGREAFPTINNTGYRYGTLNFRGVTYRLLLHRAVWAFSTNEWPVTVDHIDGNRLNNRIENLRAASYGQNNCNRGPASNNKSGFKGVVQYGDKFSAFIRYDGKSRFLGSFDTPELAQSEYSKAATLRFGEFAKW